MTAIVRGPASWMALALLLLVVASCGDDDSDGATNTPSATPEATASPTASPEPVSDLPIPDPFELYVAAADGSGSGLVYRRSASVTYAWSPDGTQLAVAAGAWDGDSGAALDVVTADAGELVSSVPLEGSISTPVWSPDGEFIVVTVGPYPDQELVAVDVDDGITKTLDSVGEVGEYFQPVGWLPSGKLMVVKGNNGPGPLRAFDVETGGSRLIGDLQVYASWFGESDLSPDGTRLAVSASAPDSGCEYPQSGVLHILDIESGVATRVPGGPCNVGDVAWSPDGTQVAFTLSEVVSENSGVFLADVAGGGIERLTSGLDVRVDWFADGTLLTYRYFCVGCEGPPPTIIEIDPTTGIEREVAFQTRADVSDDGQQVALIEQTLHVIGTDGSAGAELAPVETGWGYWSLDWAPDGSRVAYLRSHLAGIRTFEIGADGDGFVETGYFPRNHYPSPDGSRVAVIEYGQPEKADTMYLADADGSNRVDLGLQNVGLPWWSPDGRQLVVDGVMSQETRSFWVVNADGTGLRSLNNVLNTGGSEVVWSPDSSQIATLTDGLYLIDIASGEIRLFAPDSPATDLPSWSSDSLTVAYRSGRDIYVASSDGIAARRVATAAAFPFSLALSPDGRRIAFLEPGSGKDSELIVMDVTSGESEVLATGGMVSSGGPGSGQFISWSPDTQWLAVSMLLEGRGGLYLIASDGSDTRQLTDGAPYGPSRWLDKERIAFTSHLQGL